MSINGLHSYEVLEKFLRNWGYIIQDHGRVKSPPEHNKFLNNDAKIGAFLGTLGSFIQIFTSSSYKLWKVSEHGAYTSEFKSSKSV